MFKKILFIFSALYLLTTPSAAHSSDHAEHAKYSKLVSLDLENNETNISFNLYSKTSPVTLIASNNFDEKHKKYHPAYLAELSDSDVEHFRRIFTEFLVAADSFQNLKKDTEKTITPALVINRWIKIADTIDDMKSALKLTAKATNECEDDENCMQRLIISTDAIDVLLTLDADQVKTQLTFLSDKNINAVRESLE